MEIEIRETGNPQRPWGLYIAGKLWGWSKHRFDADFAIQFIKNHGIQRYMELP